MTGYRVLNPDLNYRGKSYGSWATDWFNYFISIDPDNHVHGPVVFLKSVPSPKFLRESIGNNNDINERSVFYSDPYYPRRYENIPNVRIGSDKLQISSDQVIFWPFIMSYELAAKPYQEWGALQEYTGTVMDNGDDPVDTASITINNSEIFLGKKMEMSQFRIQTPVFTAIVPEAEYGRSLRDFLEDDVQPGHYPAVVEGYFALMKFEPGNYILHSVAKAGRELRGSYVAEILVDLQVNEGDRKESSRGFPRFRSARNVSAIKTIINDKVQSGEISAEHGDELLKNANIPDKKS